MRWPVIGVVSLLVGLAGVGVVRMVSQGATLDAPQSNHVPPAAAPSALEPSVPRLDLNGLFAAGAGLRPSAEALALSGKRVRFVGFMAEMELSPKGGFYLVPRPVHCDEAGGGTADLPPASVLVNVKSAGLAALPHVPGALEGTGIFEIGKYDDGLGRVAHFRIRLDEPPGGLTGKNAPVNADAKLENPKPTGNGS